MCNRPTVSASCLLSNLTSFQECLLLWLVDYTMSGITLTYNSKEVKMKEGQLSAKSIGRAFHLFPDSIVLISDEGFLEDQDNYGYFPLFDSVSCRNFTVQGESMDPTSQATASPSAAASFSRKRKLIHLNQKELQAHQNLQVSPLWSQHHGERI